MEILESMGFCCVVGFEMSFIHLEEMWRVFVVLLLCCFAEKLKWTESKRRNSLDFSFYSSQSHDAEANLNFDI